MIVVTEKGSSPILIVGETFEKNPTTVGAFVSDEANVALKIGVQTNFPSKYIDPHYIDLKREDLNDRTHYEFTEEIVIQVRQYVIDNGIELVVCMGRTTMSMIFPSLVGKGKSLAKLVQSPFIEGLEIPGVKACCIYGYSQAYDNNNENALQEYWGRLKEIFVEKPTYYVPETEITSEEELIQLLDFLDTIPKDTKLGLDYETNAVQQFHVDYKTTMIGLSYLHDKNTAPSFWFPLDIKPSDKLVERISKFFDDNHKRIWAHNCVFEILSSWHEFGKHWEFQDTLVLLTVQGKRSSLKDAMRTHLGATLWESSVTEFMEKTGELYKWIEKCKYKDEVFELAKTKDWKALSELHDKLNSCIEWVSDNYSEEHLPRVFDAYPYPWASVPPEVLGPYCAKDAGYTLLLSEYMWKPELEMIYNFSLPHPYLAAKFEANGSKWNDSIAKIVEKEIVDKMLDTLYYLIQNLDTISSEEKMIAKDTYFKELPYDVITYTEKAKKEKRRTVSTKLDKVNELKGILNLGSNTAESRAKFWDCYFTEELQMGTILNATLEDLEFNQTLEPLLELLNSKTEGFSFQKIHPSKSLEILANIEDYLPSGHNKIVSQVGRSLNLGIDKLPELSGKYASEVIKNQYVIHSRYLGVDINDEATWSKEFKLLFNAFYHKKLAKTLSTNINGTIGRSIVYEVVGERNGVPLRGKSISEKPDLTEGVMDNSFNPLSADTWRWSSGYHTISAGSSVRQAILPVADNYVLNHCLEGNTLVKTDKGAFPIQELVGKESEIKVFASPTSNPLEKPILVSPKSVHVSKYVTELIELELQSGAIIRCTPNHKFLTKDGKWISAEDITPETELADREVKVDDAKSSFEQRVQVYSRHLEGRYGVSEGVGDERYCRECNGWIRNYGFNSHLKSQHSMTLREYHLKHREDSFAEDIKPCPYCDSGELVGYFDPKNGGTIKANCGKSKQCTSNLRSKLLSEQFKNPKYMESHKARSRVIMKEVNARPGFRDKLGEIHSERLKKEWAKDEWKEKMVSAVKKPFEIPLNHLRVSRQRLRRIPYGREYTHSHVYIVEFPDSIKIGMFYDDNYPRVENYRDANVKYLVKLSTPIAGVDLETLLLYLSWREYVPSKYFESTETRSKSCLTKVIAGLEEGLRQYFVKNEDGSYSEKEEGKLFSDVTEKMTNEWRNLDENPYKAIDTE